MHKTQKKNIYWVQINWKLTKAHINDTSLYLCTRKSDLKYVLQLTNEHLGFWGAQSKTCGYEL